MSKTKSPATYKPLSWKPFMKVVNYLCYNIAASAVLAVVVFGFVQNRHDKIADLVVIVTVTLFAFGVMFAVCGVAAWLITLPFTLLARRPLFIIRDWKFMVLDNDADTATKEGTVAP